MPLITSKAAFSAFFAIAISVIISVSGMFFSRSLHVPHWFSKYSGDKHQMTLEEARTKLSGLSSSWDNKSQNNS